MRTLYSVNSNTDLTEGRGQLIPIGITESYSAAVRIAHRKGVKGASADIIEVKTIIHDGIEYVMLKSVPICEPTPTEVAEDRKLKFLKQKQSLIQKMRETGFTQEEIDMINDLHKDFHR